LKDKDSVVDRHHFDAADPDPNFDYDADPGPDPEWHQNDADRHAYSTPSFTHVGKLGNNFTFIHSYASLQCFSFLIKGKCVIILSIFDQFS
jgi:hypothetical protein